MMTKPLHIAKDFSLPVEAITIYQASRMVRANGELFFPKGLK